MRRWAWRLPGAVLGLAAWTAAALLPALGGAHAQAAWPAKPITFIVGYPPGGGADTVARLLADRLTGKLGQQVVVENRSGASGAIGVATVMRAEPDGYTFLVAASSEIVVGPAVNPALRYDPRRDLAPVGLVGEWPYLLVATPSLPVSDMKEFVALLKANPGKYSYSSFGNHTVIHLTGEWFKTLAQVDALHVPYRGSGASMPDLLAGTVHFTFDSPVATMKLVQAGKLKALAVTAPARLAQTGDIPTTAEQGYPELLSGAWIGIMANKDTPRPIVQALNAALDEALADAALQGVLAERGIAPGGGTPQAFSERIGKELEQWRQVAQKAGLL
ncbi:tripartite tricarboxylate transporter substrate-binding protein [Orrella sp. JC864]|uniref:Bug family tripartite tricarboxylate transporter substrate binding protein n=1 Tax=Orrella sp. JC864 TaxID=3120298 RepID=UPI00300BD73C